MCLGYKGVVHIMRVLIIELKEAEVRFDDRNGVGIQQLWGTVRVD